MDEGIVVSSMLWDKIQAARLFYVRVGRKHVEKGQRRRNNEIIEGEWIQSSEAS